MVDTTTDVTKDKLKASRPGETSGDIPHIVITDVNGIKRLIPNVNGSMPSSDILKGNPVSVQVQTATSPSDNNVNQIGEIIDCSQYSGIGIGVDYLQGDETKVTLTFFGKFFVGGTEYPSGDWGAGIGAIYAEDSFDMPATQNRDWDFDVAQFSHFVIKAQMPDFTPNGTIAVCYRLYN